MKHWKVHSCLILLTATALHLAWAGNRPTHIWILPFDNPKADVSLEYLEEALPALLTVAMSQSDRHAVVDRQHVNQVLAEQSLTLEGLIAQNAGHRVGKLLGATVMITGSFVKQGQDLLITARASDVETTVVTATAEAHGSAGHLGRLVREVYRQLARGLGGRLPDLRGDQIDEAPLSNLHFMRGLGYYFSARYNHALAEFLQAVPDEHLTDVARLWAANSYLALEQYGHAYLELSRLNINGSRKVRQAEIEAKRRACEKHLSADEVEIIRGLASVQSPAVE
jgi:TolB-like protein